MKNLAIGRKLLLARRLVQQGEPVAGLFMQNWADDGSGDCRAEDDRRDAVAVCGLLGLPGGYPIPADAGVWGAIGYTAVVAGVAVVLARGVGVYPEVDQRTLSLPLAPEQVAARFDAISDRAGEIVPDMGAAQGMIELTKAQKAHGG